MANVILILILTVVVASAVRYLVLAKKKGRACIGCPYDAGCGKCRCDKDK